MLRNLIRRLSPASKASRSSKRDLQSRRLRSRPLRVENLENRITFDASFPPVEFASVELSTDTGISGFHIDRLGNVYRTGPFQGRVDFDPTVDRGANGADILVNDVSTIDSGLTINSRYYVVKYNKDGGFEWVRELKGGRTRDLIVDSKGNVFVGGDFVSTSDQNALIAGRQLRSAGSSDAFIAAYSPNGNALWASVVGPATTAQETVYDLVTDTNGSVFARVSSSNNTTQLSQTIEKRSANGVMQFRHQFATNNFTGVRGGLEIDSTGSVILATTFSGSLDVDPSSKKRIVTSTGSESGLVLKLTNAGALSWVTTFNGMSANGTVGTSDIHYVDIDPNGNIVVSGWYEGRVDFDPSSKVFDLPVTDRRFVTKLNTNGSLAWARSISLPSSNVNFRESDVTVGPDGSIYIGGFISTGNTVSGFVPTVVDFTPGVAGGDHMVNTSSGFVLKYTPVGAYAWSVVFDHEEGSSSVSSLFVDTSNSLYVRGSVTDTTIDLDPSDDEELLTAEGTQRFMVKWKQI
ncbi:hypothetical protein SH449x_001740 [Pirellulaceae bacterium SH449]